MKRVLKVVVFGTVGGLVLVGVIMVIIVVVALSGSGTQPVTSESPRSSRLGDPLLSIPTTAAVSAVAAKASRVVTPSLELLSMGCTQESFGNFGGYAYLQGEVKNVSNRPLENVMVQVSWYTDSEEFITSDDALINLNPILPGQTSPFKTITTLNPAMSNCKMSFKALFGGSISYRTSDGTIHR